MNLSALRYFLTLADAGSFTRAAARLNVTQPTLSTAIARLEEQLGARLFERDRKRVSLTPAGQKLVPHAQSMLEEWRQAQANLRVARPRRRVRVGVLPTLPLTAAAGFPERLLAGAEGLLLEIQEATPSALAARLLQGRLDIALSRIDDLPDGLEALPLRREAYRLAVSASNLLAARHRCSVRDLSDTPFLIRARCEVTEHAGAVFAENGVRPPVLLRSPNEELVASLVSAGRGACFLPESLLRPGMAQLAIDELPLTRRLGLLWRVGLDAEIVEMAQSAAQGLRWQPGPRLNGLGFAH